MSDRVGSSPSPIGLRPFLLDFNFGELSYCLTLVICKMGDNCTDFLGLLGRPDVIMNAKDSVPATQKVFAIT